MTSLDLPSEISAVAAALPTLHAFWAVAGGWAIDLALGRVSRPHADVDIAVFETRAWLRRALLRATPHHPWATALRPET